MCASPLANMHEPLLLLCFAALQGRVAAGARAYGGTVAAPSRMVNGRGMAFRPSGPGSKKGRENLPKPAVMVGG